MPPLFRALLRLLPLPALSLCLLTLLGLAALPCAAATYYVLPTGSDSNAGTLAAPFLTIQHGINTASSGDTVTVEDGTYTGPGNVDLDFGGRNITVTSQNGAAETIIDCGGSVNTSHRGFYLHTGETSAVISGLTVQNGYESINTYGSNGGGIDISSASATIQNCILKNNYANNGGGTFASGTNTVSLINCILTGNTATDHGGGIDVFSGTSILTNCTLTGNASNNVATAVSGGGICNFFGTIMLTNDIVYGDTGGEIVGVSVTANYCDIQGGYPGTGNINADPAFVNSPTDLHLKNFSLCLGAGTASGAPTTDITGATRPYPPSIGAYEAAVPVPGSDDFFVVTSENSGSNTIGEYTPTGHYVRTITVPGSTGPDAGYGLELLRGIAATDAGQLVAFNGTLSPNLTTYFPTTLSFTSETAPGWKAGDTNSSGSIGIYQGYTFVVNQNALLRFNPDGTSQQFAYNSENPTAYINLAVGMDSKVYALRLNLAGGQTSAWALDVYDPISLAPLRTINLQLPYTQNSQAVDLRNFAVDAQGSIYAIELYNNVYHFDTNGNLLQSASHGQGGYTNDIKIDPVTGNLLISVDSYIGKIIKTNPSLSSFQTLVTLDPNQADEGFITFSNAALAATLIGSPTLTATAGAGSVSLQWTAPSGAPGATYSVSRGTASGSETLIQSGLTTTSFTDTAVTGGTQYYYTVQAVTASQTSAVSNEVSATPTAPILGKVRYFPRSGYEYRTIGGAFQGSHDGITWTTLFTVTTKPADAWTEGPVTADPKTFRFLRYLAPNGSYGNVAEIEFYTGAGASAVKLTGQGFGTPGSYNNSGNGFAKVLDGNTSTYFDAPAPGNGDFAGIDQAPPPTGLTATGGNAQITLSWAASLGATSYRLYRGTTLGGESRAAYKSGLHGTSYVDTSVMPGVTYYYTLQAVTPSGLSGVSNETHAATGSLSGSSAPITASQTINLTTLGTTDWAHWGTATATSFDHKAASGTTPVGLLSNYTVVGSGTVIRYPTSLANCTWTAGTPTVSATNSGEVYVTGTGNGFQLTVPADLTRRTLTLYVGGYKDTATLTAHLSDGSAVDFVDASYGSNKPGSADGAHYQAVYTLSYGAASAGQALTVSWVQTSAFTASGNVTLQAATLAITP